jgi:anti-anti-sigma factor
MSVSIRPIEADPPVFHVVGRPTRTGPTWVWAQHDLDMATEPAARAELETLFADATAPRFVLVYLGGDRFVDVRGLRLLSGTAREARSRGGDLAVVAPPRCVSLMVARFGLADELFLAHDARHAARWARAGARRWS